LLLKRKVRLKEGYKKKNGEKERGDPVKGKQPDGNAATRTHSRTRAGRKTR